MPSWDTGIGVQHGSHDQTTQARIRESADLEHYAEAFSQALASAIRYRDIPVSAWAEALRKAGVPEHLLKHLLVMADLHQQGRYDRMTDDLVRLTDQPATRAQDFVKLHAREFTPATAPVAALQRHHPRHRTELLACNDAATHHTCR